MSKYNNKKYEDAVEKIGLWESEKIIFNKYLKKENMILDIGCGAGRVAISLYNEGYKNIIGIDIEKEFIDYAKKIVKEISFYCEDITKTSFNDNEFDSAIFSFNGLMTMDKQDQEKALKEISRIVKPQGYFIFTTFDYSSYKGDKPLLNNILNVKTGLKLHIPTIKEIKELISSSQFELISYENRINITEERKEVKEFSGNDSEINTIFWITKNNKKDINTPEELLKYMSENINYGYLGKDGRVYHYDDENFNEKWHSEYVLQNKDSILKTRYGTCWDQVEFERYWFNKNNYEIKTIYEMVNVDYKNDYPTHSFLIYKENDTWNWFENSDFNNRGIHTFNSYKELIKYQYNRYLDFLKEFNIKKEEIDKIIMTEFTEPNDNINADEYINHVLSSKIINYK